MKRVSIVGNAPGRKFPRMGEVWVVNTPPPKRARYTRAFQLHPDKGRLFREDLFLITCPVTIYTAGKYTVNPKARPYPISNASGLGGPFCSSFDYMMALAILEGFSQIDLYGISLQFGTPRERLMEHVSLGYWIGLARGRGIRVNIHGKGLLTFPYRYGFDYDKERTFGQRMSFWAALNNLNFQFDDGQAKSGTVGWEKIATTKKVMVGI